MKKIIIDNELKNKYPDTCLASIYSKVKVKKNNPKLKELILTEAERIKKELVLADISKISTINDSRRAYKAFGKDPSRYRLSAEALHRRILKAQDLYFINNLVDLTNLISLKTGFSLGTYDCKKIKGNITFSIAKEGATYEGINRGILNIESLPSFEDQVSYFGNPTGDSSRTKVDENTNELLLVILSFSNKNGLPEAVELAQELLIEFAEAKELEIYYSE